MALFKQMSKVLNNEKGMSLPVVLVTATVGLILTVSMTQSLMSGSGMTTKREKIVAYETFAENFKNVLEDPGACTEMLGGRGIRLNLGRGQITPITVGIDHDNDGQNMLHDGWKDDEGSFGIGRIEVEILSATSVNTMRHYNPNDYQVVRNNPSAPLPLNYLTFTYPARVMLHPRGVRAQLSRETNSQRINEYKHSFEEVDPLHQNRIDMRIFVNVDSNRQIMSCYGYQSDAAVCGAAGGTYDFANVANNAIERMKCKPDKRCFGSPDGLVTDPNACSGPFGYNPGTLVGQVNGVDQYMCLWCHPYVGDTASYQDPTGGTSIGQNEDWLATQWKGLAQRVKANMDAGIAATDPETAPLAMEWENLVNITIESGTALDTTTQAYQEAQAAQEEVDRLNIEKMMKEDEVNNLNTEIADLTDELDACQRTGQMSSPDCQQSQQLMDQAQADLPRAQSELDQINSDLASAQQTLDGMTDVAGTGQTATEFTDPIAQVENYLMTEHGIDQSVIEYMDLARGL